MLDKETVDCLETLLKRGQEVHLWIVVPEATTHPGEFGALINDPNELEFDDAEMEDCVYAPTIIEAINLAVRRWR